LVNRLLEKENIPTPDIKSVSILNATLEQNYPNPFNRSTTISYNLPQTFSSAKIVVIDSSGRIFKQVPLSTAGAGSITIEAGTLPVGVYHYSLYVDNVLADTKKMVLTK